MIIPYTQYHTPGEHNTQIPTREEFHRYAMERLYSSDFCTDYPGETGMTAAKIESSLRWTQKNTKERKWMYWGF